MRAVGLLAGVGSMLHDARALGYQIVGNVEPRSNLRSLPWWEMNFPEATSYRELGNRLLDEKNPGALPSGFYGADLALGHPPCGAHSQLGNSGVPAEGLSAKERAMRHERRRTNVGLLPLFVQLVRRCRPKMFALDNLPKILRTVAPIEWWQAELPGYHLSTAIIFNRDYGSVQRRRRLWVFGTRRDACRKPFELRPIARRPKGAPQHVLDALDGLPWEPWMDDHPSGHVHLQPGDYPVGGFRINHDQHFVPFTDELALRWLNIPPNHAWRYITSTGRAATKLGVMRSQPLGACRVLTGMPAQYHPLTGWTYTPRERARLMGWADDFKLNDDRLITRKNFRRYVVVTGKGVPGEFVRYLIPQLTEHLRRNRR